MLSSDSPLYGGYGNIDETVHHFTIPDPLFEPHGVAWLRLYMPARSAQVLKLVAGSGKRCRRLRRQRCLRRRSVNRVVRRRQILKRRRRWQKRKPGRPKKIDPEAEAPAVKRKPGRPRKTDPEAEAPAVKRRPGRPKKSEAEKPAGRKPGRPKKKNKHTPDNMRCGGSSENAVAPHVFYKAVRAVGRCARDIQMRFADGLRNKMQIGSMTCR